jgi:cytochrome c
MMRKCIILLSAIALFSCKKEEKKEALYPEGEAAKTPVALGQEIFEGKGNCFDCHKPDQKVIGPSIQEIAQAYKKQGASIVSFLKEEAKPIVDPSQYETMKTNFALTKNLSDDELKALEAYILSEPKP